MLIVLEYKKFVFHYVALVLSNQYSKTKEKELDIENNYSLLYINNTLGKLIKYQELILILPIYATFIAINLTFY